MQVAPGGVGVVRVALYVSAVVLQVFVVLLQMPKVMPRVFGTGRF